MNIVAGTVGVIALAALVTSWLFLGDPSRQQQLEALRIAAAIVFGLGGAVGLYLAAKRQQVLQGTLNQNRWVTLVGTRDRSAELEQRKLADRAQILDAEERRITDLYTKAADQLGSDKVAVRLAGVYALERLANNSPAQRQAIVNVFCAYMRMSTGAARTAVEAEPNEKESSVSATTVRIEDSDNEVKRSIEQVLADGLSAHEGTLGWSGVRVNLAGAELVDLKLRGANLRTLDLSSVRIAGALELLDCTISEKFSLVDTVCTNGTIEGLDLRDVESTIAKVEAKERLKLHGVKFPTSFTISSLQTAQGIELSECSATLQLWVMGGRHGGRAEFKKCSFTILRMDNVTFDGKVQFIGNGFGGVRLDDVLAAKWATEEGDLHPGFSLASYDEHYNFVSARIPPYWIGPDGEPSRDLIE